MSAGELYCADLATVGHALQSANVHLKDPGCFARSSHIRRIVGRLLICRLFTHGDDDTRQISIFRHNLLILAALSVLSDNRYMEANKQTRNTPSRDADAELGRRAHMIMWDRKLKQKQVAGMLSISSDALGRKLKGERGWALAEVISLAGVLNTSVSYLVGESDEPHPDGPSEVSNLRPTD